MAWKGVHITRPGRLSVADDQLVVAQEAGEVRVPLEDIGWIVVDEPAVTLTGALLAALPEHGIPLVMADSRHMPALLALPFHSHHRQAATAAAQLDQSQPFRKRCWQALVRSKVANQAAVLEHRRRPQAATLRAMRDQVASGDPDNVEARAARAYWPALFERFVRDDPSDLRNALLNYGYAVVRAVIARSLVAAGFMPCVGLHHASVTNAFNLADDLIEPFRPFADHVVARLAEGRERAGTMTREDRRTLANMPNTAVRLPAGEMALLHAADHVVASLRQATEARDASRLLLPEFQGGLFAP
jgi:CRISPR-associated protein Cas1